MDFLRGYFFATLYIFTKTHFLYFMRKVFSFCAKSNIEMLQLLAKEFNVSINELLAGQKMSDEEFRKNADENIIAVSKESAFSFEERKAYFKKKWRKEHISLFVVLLLIIIVAFVLPFVVSKPWFVGLVPLIAFIEYGYQNNRMMIYVENCLYK